MSMTKRWMDSMSETETVTLNLEKLIAILVQIGFTASAGCWESDRMIYAFSKEIYGPATYGHPKAAVQFNKETGYFSIQSPAIQVSVKMENVVFS